MRNLGKHRLSVRRKPGTQPPPKPSTYVSLPGIWVPASTPCFLPTLHPQGAQSSPLAQDGGAHVHVLWSETDLGSGMHSALLRGFLEGPRRSSLPLACPLLVRLNPSVTQRLLLGWDGCVSLQCCAHLHPLPLKLVSAQN